jgi:hypothetical protein
MKRVKNNCLKICCCFLLLSIGTDLSAQSQGMRENTRAELDGIKTSSVTNEIFVEGNGNYNNQRLAYSQIQGSPFWNDIFYPADLYVSGNKNIGRYLVRYNLASQEFHYKGKDSVELVVSTEMVNRIVLYNSADTINGTSVFVKNIPGLLLNDKLINDYVQQMNVGKYILYKHTKRAVVIADSLFGAVKRYYFGSTNTYFLQTPKEVIQLKKISDDNILSSIPPINEMEKWIKENKIKMNRELDVLRFLTYYNQHIEIKR